MRKLKQLSALLMTFALYSCATVEEKIIDSGPSITSCVSDNSEGGYHCAAIDKVPTFVSFKDAPELQCVGHVELESFLKSCKKRGEVKALIFCTKDCTDNSFCASPKDWKRIGERCVQ